MQVQVTAEGLFQKPFQNDEIDFVIVDDEYSLFCGMIHKVLSMAQVLCRQVLHVDFSMNVEQRVVAALDVPDTMKLV